MNRDESDKVYDSLCMMLEVSNIQNNGENPPFIVIPRHDLMRLRNHRRAMEWLQFTPQGATFYGVPLVETERLDDNQSRVGHFTTRLTEVDQLMSMRDDKGRGVMEHQSVLYVLDDELAALFLLHQYGRPIPSEYNLAGLQFNGRPIRVATPTALRHQCEVADRARSIVRSSPAGHWRKS